jgi:hypothetical protein
MDIGPNRVITGWWDGQPIHRAKTAEETLIESGASEKTANLGINLLGEKDYKPTFPL